jgi:hypothetical protein
VADFDSPYGSSRKSAVMAHEGITHDDTVHMYAYGLHESMWSEDLYVD